MRHSMKALALVAAMGLAGMGLAAGPASADSAPSAQEWQRLVTHLSSLGYTSWEEIDWGDDGYWEVDDAIGPDGVEYDLKLDPETLEVIERERD